MDKFLDDNGYENLEAIYGIASRKAVSTPAELFAAQPLYSVVDHEKCQYPKCDICIRLCFYDSLQARNDKVDTRPEKCIGCELCINVCPFDAMWMTEDKDLALSA